ncbi:hypothetical protein LIER_31072 [Lithospermum erythrorhizon]|uniref:Uncharacterized protein n=1 Tax=Lithospermum erythrorhizon TaxID=34254 RepID=A0AAV3RTS0_LITER
MVFDGVPDLGTCFAQVSGEGSSGCGGVAGPAKAVRLMFRMFGTAMYLVDPLVSQPSQPVSYCSTSSAPRPGPGVPVTPSLAPLATSLPPPKPVVKPPNPVVRPMPPLPPICMLRSKEK